MPDEKQVNWKRVGWIVAAAVVILGILLALWWYFFLRGPKEVTNTVSRPPTKTTKTSTPSATPSAKKDETAGWKTYENSTLGFSFKYPSGYNIYDISILPCLANTGYPNSVIIYHDTLDENCTFVDSIPSDIFITSDIFINREGKNLESFYTNDSVEIEVGGEKGVKDFIRSGPTPPLTNIYVLHDTKVYSILFMNKDYKGNYNPIYDSILSTFRFI